MLTRFIEIARRRTDDRAKARAYAASAAAAQYRAAVAEHDAFLTNAPAVGEPAFLVGTARDSMGEAVPIRLAPEAIAAHWLVQGATGSGKTTFVAGLVAWALCYRIPVGVVDCKSGFFHAAMRWAGALAYELPAAEQAAFIRRLAVVHPFGDDLAPLNVCRLLPGISPEAQAYDVTLALSRLFEAAMSVHMENILRHLVLLLVVSDLTLVEAPLVLQDEVLRGILVERSGNPVLKGFFFGTYTSLPRISTDALLGRLSALLLPENVRLMLGADRCIDVRGVLCRGDPLFAFFGKGAGAPEELVNVLASLFLQHLLLGAYSSEGRHRPYLVVFDEFFHLLTAPALAERFATGLATLRSFAVGLGLIMHSFSQVPPALREAVLTHCDYVAVFRSAMGNTKSFGDFLPEVDPDLVAHALRLGLYPPSRRETSAYLTERLQRLPNRHCYWYDRRQQHRAVLLRVPDLPEPHETVGLSAGALDAFITEHGIAQGGLAVPQAELRRQIAARQERLRQLLRPPLRVVTSAPTERASKKQPVRSGNTRRPQLG